VNEALLECLGLNPVPNTITASVNIEPQGTYSRQQSYDSVDSASPFAGDLNFASISPFRLSDISTNDLMQILNPLQEVPKAYECR